MTSIDIGNSAKSVKKQQDLKISILQPNFIPQYKIIKQLVLKTGGIYKLDEYIEFKGTVSKLEFTGKIDLAKESSNMIIKQRVNEEHKYLTELEPFDLIENHEQITVGFTQRKHIVG